MARAKLSYLPDEHCSSELLEDVLAAGMQEKHMRQPELVRQVYQQLGYTTPSAARGVIDWYCRGMLFGCSSARPSLRRREFAPRNLAAVLHAVGVTASNPVVAEAGRIFAAYDLSFSYPPPRTQQP